MSATGIPQWQQVLNEVRDSVKVLGPSWGGYEPIWALCVEFERRCQAIEENSGDRIIPLIFVGPKNAGKTTMVSLLLKNEARQRELECYIGEDNEHSTKHPVRLSENGDIPCARSDFVDLGFPIEIIDTPGLDEGSHHQGRAESARLEIDKGRIKVLVLHQKMLQTEAWRGYIHRAAGSIIVPIISQVVSDIPADDLWQFKQRLEEAAPMSPLITPPIIIKDYRVQGADKEAILEDAQKNLMEAVSRAGVHLQQNATVAGEIYALQVAFRKDVGDEARKALPATETALRQLNEQLHQLPLQAGRLLLGRGREKEVRANIRAALRASMLDQTPPFLFPWRLCLSIANVVHGATDRLILALSGSLPSILMSGWTAAKNIKEGLRFNRTVQAGLKRQIERTLRGEMTGDLDTIYHNLKHDLGVESPGASLSPRIRLQGIDALQEASTEAFRDAINTSSPSWLSSWFVGLVGCAAFWAIMIQPIVGLYADFYAATQAVLSRNLTALEAFPAHTFSMLGTSVFLALLPMSLFLLLVVTWVGRNNHVTECYRILCEAHDQKMLKLRDATLIKVSITEPRLDACLNLLSLPGVNDPAVAGA